MRSAWALTPVLAVGLSVGFDGPARPPVGPPVRSDVLPACLWDPAPKAGADPAAWERSWKCGEEVRALIHRGDEAVRERLWSIFDEIPEASPVRAMMIDAFLDGHLARALEDLEGNPPPGAVVPMVDPPDEALPDHLKPAPVELRQAWWLFQQAKGEAQRAHPRPAKGEGIAFQSHEPAFQNAVAGLLRGRVAPAEAVRELTRFEWGGWCGTGSDSLYIPQSKALMIAYLRLGRLDLATAASAGLASWMLPPDGPAPWDRRLLGASGIEWERFYLGGVVSGEAGFADLLARQGSDQAAQQLVAATRLMMGVKEESAVDLVGPLAALVERTRSCSDYATMSLREVDREPDAPPVSGSVQAEALELLAERVRLGAGLDEADAASHLLVRLCRPESREAFRTMLRSPYSEVRRRGAIGLRGLGETVPEPKASAAVVFRLLASGKPLAHQQVEWTLSSGAGSVSSSAETDAKGMLSLDRDPLVDPRRPVTSIVLAGRERGSSDGLRFEVKLAPPRDLDAVTTVSVRPIPSSPAAAR